MYILKYNAYYINRSFSINDVIIKSIYAIILWGIPTNLEIEADNINNLISKCKLGLLHKRVYFFSIYGWEIYMYQKHSLLTHFFY